MTVHFDMSEVKKLAADLDRAGPTAERVSSVAMTAIAAEFAVGARADAAVDTGELRNSIVVRGGKDYRVIVATAPHASMVEYGTSDTAPQPYMWPQVSGATRALEKALGAIDPFTSLT